ncbi:MAG: T9SS type A sorting domain-containing protein [Bacteroidetes bacterium]|nr:T9SS type A sorting domain-containing protein [Bacteroidota bacterium]
MNKILICLLFPVLAGISGLAQKAVMVVSKPVYFDVSPSLRDMASNQPYKVDLTGEKPVKNHFRKSRQKLADNFVDPVLQRYNGRMIVTDTTIQNFDGGGNTEGVLPPDTHGDVSASVYFQDVNMHFSIYDKTGTLLLTSPNTTVWSGMPNNYNGGDGVVNYDEQADRWLFTQLSYAGNQYWQMVAVSQTSDPTGSWYRWEYAFGSTLPDYPKWGVWPDGYYMSCNRFAGGSSYAGIGANAFDRTAMLTGDPTAQMITFNLSASDPAFTPMPSDCDGIFPPMGTPNYFTYMNDSPCSLGIYEFHVDWTTPANSTFSNFLSLPVTTFSSNQTNIPQMGTTHKLDAIPDRLMYRSEYRKFAGHESMVLNHTVNAGSNVAGIRWYELRKTLGNWSVYQQSTYSPDANCRWMGSIAMDYQGNIALGYSISSSSMYPSIRYTGRFANDPINTMTIAEKGIFNGGGSETSATARWGDYSSMTADTSNTFWYTQEYYSTTSGSGWKTRIASFSFANIFQINITATQTTICYGDSTQLNANATGGSGVYTYLWSSLPAGFTDTIPNPFVAPLLTTKYICEVSDGSNTKTDTIKITVRQLPYVFAGNDTTLTFTVTDFQASGQDSSTMSFQWSTLGDGTFDTAYILHPLYSTGWQDRMAGTFTLTLSGYPSWPCNPITVDSIKVTFSPSVGVPQILPDRFSISIFPNPAQNNCTLTINNLPDGRTDISITDLSGRQVFSDVIKGRQKSVEKTIDLSSQAKGVYFVYVRSSNGFKVEKLVLK